jgi:hypothetical protein
MGDDDGTTRRAFAKCDGCGNEVAVLRRSDGRLVRINEACGDCGSTSFSEVPPEDLEDMSSFVGWADEDADGLAPDPGCDADRSTTGEADE